MRTWRIAAVLAVTAGCIYGAPRADQARVDDDCRRACADSNDACVRNGEARKWGLPGVTYDLCSHELDACRDRCRSASAPVLDAGSDTAPREGVDWSGATLRCPWASSSVTVPAELAGKLDRISSGEVRLVLGADAAFTLQSGRGEPPGGLDAWLALQAQLTPWATTATLQVNSTLETTSMTYAVPGDAGALQYRARHFTERRAGTWCRAIAIEREGFEPKGALLRLVRVPPGFNE